MVVDVGGQMPAEVVDGVERRSPGRRIRLRRSHPDQQRPGQSGPDRGRDHVGPVDRTVDSARRTVRTERLEMGPRGDLRNHAAVTGVLVDAGGHLIGQQLHQQSGCRQAIPTPVSSQELSMARMVTAASWCRLPPHGVRVGATGSVVPLAYTDLLEAQSGVERQDGLSRCRCASRYTVASGPAAASSSVIIPADATALEVQFEHRRCGSRTRRAGSAPTGPSRRTDQRTRPPGPATADVPGGLEVPTRTPPPATDRRRRTAAPPVPHSAGHRHRAQSVVEDAGARANTRFPFGQRLGIGTAQVQRHQR